MLANTPPMLEAITACRCRGGAQHPQHPARCGGHRLLARPCRDQGADRRPRILAGVAAGGADDDAGGEAASSSTIDDPEFDGRRAHRLGEHRLRGVSSPRAIPILPGACPTTNGTRSRSTTHPAPPAIPRASSITTAAPYLHGARAMSLTGGDGTKHPVYLWTLPMFHCNGWCFPWTISVVGGTHVSLRWVRAKAIWRRARRARRHPSLRRADRHVDDPQRAGRGQARALARRSSSSPPPRRRPKRCSRRWRKPASTSRISMG